MSIAYDKPEPAIDGNVMRVYSRIFKIEEDIAKPATRKIFEQKVLETISQENPSSYNQALMELGALICTPSSPKCLECPMNSHCQAFKEGIQNQLPIKTKIKRGKTIHFVSVIVENEKGELLIQKRPNKGLLAGLWEFPMYELMRPIHLHTQLTLGFEDQYGGKLFHVKQIGNIKHLFSHLTWEVQVYTAQVLQTEKEGLWVSEKDLSSFTLPIPVQKMYELFAFQK